MYRANEPSHISKPRQGVAGTPTQNGNWAAQGSGQRRGLLLQSKLPPAPHAVPDRLAAGLGALGNFWSGAEHRDARSKGLVRSLTPPHHSISWDLSRILHDRVAVRSLAYGEDVLM